MSEHTAGPWRVEEGTTLIWGDCNPDDMTSYGMGYPIAECRITPSGSWAKGPKKYDEAEANARLIAAAPELLSSIKKLSDVYDQIWVKMSDGEADMCLKAWAEVTEAIAKAEGRSNG